MADSGQAEGKGKVKGHHLHSNDVKYHCSLIQINITCTEQIHVYTDSQSVFPGCLCGSWNNIPINQSDLRDKFTIYIKFRLTTSVIPLSLFSDFRDNLRVELGLGVGKGLSIIPVTDI